MSNSEKYLQAFVTVLGIPAEDVPGLTYHCVPEWDSARHMELVAVIEEALGIMFEPDDILDFSGFEKGRELLSARYGVDFSK